MRWGSLASILMMAVSSTMAPRLLSKFTGIDQQGLATLVSQVQYLSSGQVLDDKVMAQVQAISQAEATSGGADPAPEAAIPQPLRAAGPGADQVAAMMAQLQSLQQGRTDDVSLEQLAAIQDMAQGQSAGAGGLPGQMQTAMGMIQAYQKQKPVLEQWRSGLLRDSERVRQFYRSHRQQVLGYLFLAGLVLSAAAILGAVSSCRGLVRFVLGMAFGLSSRFLLLVSLAALVYFAASRVNPWPLLPPEVLAAPVTYMLLAGVFLRALDPNYPLWNTLLKSLAAPLAACLGVTAWVAYQPALWAKLKPLVAARLA
ncbi:MAG: hypothetical protein PHU21_15005 [Elusimicrobia bacterium]|nr:hypothetical protein [Elusimicrobiota bacterium]